jgi:phosphohistidine phosphatase
VVGRWLAEQGLVPDVVVCSDAERARETSELVVAGILESGLATGLELRPTRDLYAASVEDVLEVVAGTPDDVRRLLVVGHEPTASEVLVALTGSSPALPTAAVAVVRLDGAWRDVGAGTGTLVAFKTPKD